MNAKIYTAGLAMLCIYSCNSPESIQSVQDTTTYHQQKSTVIDTPFKSAAAEAKYFENEANKRADIYNNRTGFITKMENIDRSLDFSGNYDQDSDSADNTISGNDKYGLNVQIMGSKKHVKEINFTYYPNLHYGIRAQTLDVISNAIKIICKQPGSNWSILHLSEILAKPDNTFLDSVILENKKLIIDYDTTGPKIDLVISHK